VRICACVRVCVYVFGCVSVSVGVGARACVVCAHNRDSWSVGLPSQSERAYDTGGTQREQEREGGHTERDGEMCKLVDAPIFSVWPTLRSAEASPMRSKRAYT